MLDLIQVFVEALDRMFENVCELDLVFGYDEVQPPFLHSSGYILGFRGSWGRGRARKGPEGEVELKTRLMQPSN